MEFKLHIPAAEIQKRTQELAQDIVDRYKDVNPLFVCLLKGAVPFTTDLMRAIEKLDPDFVPDVEYMRTTTYSGTEAGKTAITGDLPGEVKESVKGRVVIIIDDVIDEGNTMSAVVPHIHNLGAREVTVVTMLQKNDVERKPGTPDADLYGFDSGPEWVIGNGLNDDGRRKEAGRWMTDILIKIPGNE
jgi:hypoxanthine phosphoribosyltransferase